MPRPKKTEHVSIPSTLFEALILCRRELLAMYAKFNNHSFYKELNDGVDWKIVNDWEHSNMLTKTSPIGSLPAKLNIPYIANYIYSFSSDKCKLLEFLRQNEIRDRIQGLFDDDLEDDTVLANKPDFANVDQLAKSISKELQINLGPPSNYAWLKSATFSQLMTICGEIKETIEDEKEEDGSL